MYIRSLCSIPAVVIGNIMSRFVQVRYASYSHMRAITQCKHDFRIQQPKNNRTTTDQFHNQFKNYEDTTYKSSLSRLNNHRKQHNTNYYNSRKRNLKDSQASIMSGIISLSNTNDLQNKKYTDKQLNKVFMQALNKQLDEIEKMCGTRPEIIYSTIHYHENTAPHLQFQISNYKDDGLSIFGTINKKKNLSKLQDVVGKSFKSLNFKRGISKEITKKHHQKIIERDVIRVNKIKEREAKRTNMKKSIAQQIDKIFDNNFQVFSRDKVKRVLNNFVNNYIEEKLSLVNELEDNLDIANLRIREHDREILEQKNRYTKQVVELQDEINELQHTDENNDKKIDDLQNKLSESIKHLSTSLSEVEKLKSAIKNRDECLRDNNIDFNQYNRDKLTKLMADLEQDDEDEEHTFTRRMR